jgi:hypothetical protein
MRRRSKKESEKKKRKKEDAPSTAFFPSIHHPTQPTHLPTYLPTQLPRFLLFLEFAREATHQPPLLAPPPPSRDIFLIFTKLRNRPRPCFLIFIRKPLHAQAPVETKPRIEQAKIIVPTIACMRPPRA